MLDKYGRPIDMSSILQEMSSPYRCLRCNHIHDAAKVVVVGHYSDCTMWKCPRCGATIDDRPIGWGGSAERLR